MYGLKVQNHDFPGYGLYIFSMVIWGTTFLVNTKLLKQQMNAMARGTVNETITREVPPGYLNSDGNAITTTIKPK